MLLPRKKTLSPPPEYYHDYIQTEIDYYFFLSHMIDNEISMHVKISNFCKFS